jgi:hypothetical protein
MPNSFEYADWLAMESLDSLVNKLSLPQFMNTDYSKEFKLRFPVSDTIRVPYPAAFRAVEGLEYQPQAIVRRHATVEFFEPFQVGFEWDSAEAALQTPRGREKVAKEILDPAMDTMAQKIEDKCAQWMYQHAASVTGALGTNPTTYDATSAAAREIMAELACPTSGDRGLFVPPAVMRGVKTANVALFNPVQDISRQFRRGVVGQADGFEWYENMSLYRHTAGTWQGAVTLTTTSVNGASTIVVTCTTGDTFLKGDKISIASVLPVNPGTRRTFGTTAKTFTVLADATGVSSSATLTISPAIYGPTSPYQNVDALPVAGAVLTLWPGTASPSGKTGTVGLALHSNAFAMVNVELEEPKGSSVELVSQKRDPSSGVAIRFIRIFDGKSSKMINRFDCMIGFGDFYNDSGAVAIACG